MTDENNEAVETTEAEDVEAHKDDAPAVEEKKTEEAPLETTDGMEVAKDESEEEKTAE